MGKTAPLSLVLGFACAWSACGDDGNAPRRPEPTDPPIEPPAPPVRVRTPDPLPERAVTLALGGAHSCVLDDELRCWGSNQYGQLGVAGMATGPGAHSAEPGVVEGVADALRVFAGHFHTCIVAAGGVPACWGHNGYGQLGTGDTDDRIAPFRIELDEPAVALALGEGHTCARLASRKVACWGRNEFGQLGDGTTTQRLVPAIVEGIDDAVAIGAGRDHTCTLLGNGRVMCWGAGYEGQLGSGDREDRRARPDLVRGVTEARALAVGSAHACVLSDEGAVQCWGRNDGRQIGAGEGGTPEAIVLSAMRVTSIAGAVEIDAGARHTCARLGSGGVRCWGYNGFGQLGDGTDEEREGPVDVAELGGATHLALGVRHGCARNEDGSLWCWGRNHAGQLGDGTTEARHAPVRVGL